MSRARTWETRARDLGMHLVALIIVFSAIDRWLVHLPSAPVGLATGSLVGVGNVLLWHRRSTATVSAPARPDS